MKKVVSFLLMIVVFFAIAGCSKTSEIKLEGNDLEAYNLMLEVCYVASDPSKVSVISGTVSDDLGVFKVSYDNGVSTYNVLVSKEDGEYVAERLDDSLVSAYKDLLYATDDFNARNVNKALKNKWKN